ncbi:hypothetical protein Bca52824_083449 [Brassica carinata]|uniref:Uncharacterized protein n=1 Tax=Brassica carinata TaxID=52824 RepID=A0A8X7PMC7_BRACI|nr:hypothetical protein Bca52824_083449 [Brassica carinata]
MLLYLRISLRLRSQTRQWLSPDEKLLSGESGISLIDRFDASKFPTRFGGQIHGFSSEGYIDGVGLMIV